MTLLQHHVLALSLTAITTFGLGWLVFLAGPRRRLNQIFGLYSLAITWWGVGEALVVGANSQPMATMWSYVEWPGVMLIAPTFFHTVLLATEQTSRAFKRLLWTVYSLSALFIVLHLFTGWVTGPPRSVGYATFHNRVTALGLAIPLLFLILVNLALWLLAKSRKGAAGRRKTQLQYLFWGSLLGYLGGSPDWFFTMGFSMPILNPFGIYGVPCYSLAITYAALQHRLFDVHLVIRKSLVYSLLITFLTIGYFALIYMVEGLFRLTLGYQSTWLSLLAFALMALAFQPLKMGIQRVVDWLLFRAPQEELVRRVERLEAEARQTEKFKATATMATGMAHEIKNPLTSIKTFAEYLPNKYDDPSFREKFTRLVPQEIDRINRLVQRMLEFAKPKPPERRSVRFAEVADEILELLHDQLVAKRIQVVKAYSLEDHVLADPEQLKQALLNIFLNSIEAMIRPGCITVATVSENGHLTIVVADTGPGIAKEDLPRVFDPFFTRKLAGTGLGLSVVHSIIAEHGGTIRLDSAPGRGTTVAIQLPRP